MEEPVNIAVLDLYNQVPNEGMRCIRQLLAEFSDKHPLVQKLDYFEVRHQREIPDYRAYDIFLSSGGPGDPLLVGESWEKPYLALMDACRDHNRQEIRKKWVFFICHSFQVVIQHWKLAEVSRRKSTAFGVMPIHKVGMGLEEPLFEGLAEPFYAVDSRDFQVVQPNRSRMLEFGASILCLEKFRPTIPLERAIMAIRFSGEMLGTQFHPEADPKGMTHYLQTEAKRQLVIAQHGEEKYLEMLEHLEDEDKIRLTQHTILPRFLAQAMENLSSYRGGNPGGIRRQPGHISHSIR